MMSIQRALVALALALAGCADTSSLSREGTPSGTSTFNAPYEAVYDLALVTAAEGGLLVVSEDRASGDIRLSSGSYRTGDAFCAGNLLGVFLTRDGERTRVQVQERVVWVTHAVSCRDLAPLLMSRLTARVYNRFGIAGGTGGPQRGQSGSGYFISSAGHLLTNAHVIEGCTRDVTLSGPSWLPQNSQVRIVNRDTANDLALLQLADGRAQNHVRFRASMPALGESVVALGYPYQPVLAAELNATTGSISSLAGPRNDRRTLQITAPIQPGNSGGPVVDESGTVIGTVVASLEGVQFQNVNFAVNNTITRAFLQLNGVEPEMSGEASKKDVTQLAAEARQYVVSIRCIAE
jgi:S1-C subfamily serine protease